MPLQQTLSQRDTLYSPPSAPLDGPDCRGVARRLGRDFCRAFLETPLRPLHPRHIERGRSFCRNGPCIGHNRGGIFSLPLLAFVGAISSCVIVGVLGKKNESFTPERLLLAGIGLGFLFTAILMLLMSLSSDYGVRRTLLWIFGDLSYSGWALMP